MRWGRYDGSDPPGTGACDVGCTGIGGKGLPTECRLGLPVSISHSPLPPSRLRVSSLSLRGREGVDRKGRGVDQKDGIEREKRKKDREKIRNVYK